MACGELCAVEHVTAQWQCAIYHHRDAQPKTDCGGGRQEQTEPTAGVMWLDRSWAHFTVFPGHMIVVLLWQDVRAEQSSTVLSQFITYAGLRGQSYMSPCLLSATPGFWMMVWLPFYPGPRMGESRENNKCEEEYPISCLWPLSQEFEVN